MPVQLIVCTTLESSVELLTPSYFWTIQSLRISWEVKIGRITNPFDTAMGDKTAMRPFLKLLWILACCFCYCLALLILDLFRRHVISVVALLQSSYTYAATYHMQLTEL